MDAHFTKEKALFNTLFEHTTNIVVHLDKDFNILALNNNALRFFQWKLEDSVNKNFLEVCKSTNLESPLKPDFIKHLAFTEFIQERLNYYGKPYPIKWDICPLTLSDTDISILLIGKESNYEKNTMPYHLEQVMACTPGSLYWKDRQGRYLGCNEFMVKTSGLNSTHDIIGKTDFDLWPENAEKITQNDQYVINSGETVFLEETVRIPEGKVMYFTGVKMPLRDENNAIIGIIGNSLDITQLKQTQQALKEAKEKAEQASLVKIDFIRNMEHDIRTPFSGIWGLANHLCQQETDPQKKEFLGDITQSAKELLDYCNDIIDYSRIEHGSSPILEQKFDLKKLIDSIIAIETPPAKYRKLDLILNYNSNIPITLIGDDYRLQRILINLISNAIKFTNAGFVKLSVRLVKQESQKVILQFIIQDTGIGIPEEKQQFIYDKFVRLNPANQGLYKGTGLGLGIVKQFIEELQGEINLKSQVNKGTTFICTLSFKLPLIDDIVQTSKKPQIL